MPAAWGRGRLSLAQDACCVASILLRGRHPAGQIFRWVGDSTAAAWIVTGSVLAIQRCPSTATSSVLTRGFTSLGSVCLAP